MKARVEKKIVKVIFRKPDAVALAQIMDAENITPNTPFSDGATPFSLALDPFNSGPNAQIVRMLLERGADPNGVYMGGEGQLDPLVMGGYHADSDIISALLEFGAEVGNERGYRAAWNTIGSYARWKNYFQIRLHQIPVSRVSAYNPAQNTTAEEFRQAEERLVLSETHTVGLSYIEDIDIFRRKIEQGLRSLEILLAAGVEVNADKRSLLHEAATRGLPEAVSLLLQYRADPYLEDYSGKTALNLAEEAISRLEHDPDLWFESESYFYSLRVLEPYYRKVIELLTAVNERKPV